MLEEGLWRVSASYKQPCDRQEYEEASVTFDLFCSQIIKRRNEL